MYKYNSGFLNSSMVVALAGAMALTSCSTQKSGSNGNLITSSSNQAKDLKPAGQDPAWGQGIRDNMLVVIEKLQSYGAPPLQNLSAKEAREQPTPADAVMDVMKENGIAKPAAMVTKLNRTIPVNGTNIPVRIYTPTAAMETYPVIVYYHGGGWVIADLDTYDASAQALSERTGSVVVSVHYRQAPENKFPTAHNDSYAAYQWVVNNASTIKGDKNRIAVAGESAGGNLACNVSIMARDQNFQMPKAQLLVYPIANSDMNNESYTKYAEAKPLSKPLMMWFAQQYLNNMNEASDPRISLVNAKLNNLPPTLIIAAEIDPLTTEGNQLADKLRAAGVDTQHKDYNGVTHEFFGMATVEPQAIDAQQKAAAFLRRHLK